MSTAIPILVTGIVMGTLGLVQGYKNGHEEVRPLKEQVWQLEEQVDKMQHKSQQALDDVHHLVKKAQHPVNNDTPLGIQLTEVFPDKFKMLPLKKPKRPH